MWSIWTVILNCMFFYQITIHSYNLYMSLTNQYACARSKCMNWKHARMIAGFCVYFYVSSGIWYAACAPLSQWDRRCTWGACSWERESSEHWPTGKLIIWFIILLEQAQRSSNTPQTQWGITATTLLCLQFHQTTKKTYKYICLLPFLKSRVLSHYDLHLF